MKRVLLTVLFVLLGLNDIIAQRDFGVWDVASQTYTNKKYNIKWDLSELGEWRVLSKEKLPQDHIFLAALVGDYASVSLQLSEEESEVESVWLGAEGFVSGFKQGIKDISHSSHKSYGQLQYRKCYFLHREALLFEMDVTINDARLGDLSPLKCLCKGYAFSKGNNIIVVKAIFPKNYQEEFGVILDQLFFGGFDYFNTEIE